jgi:hypothetical protein
MPYPTLSELIEGTRKLQPTWSFYLSVDKLGNPDAKWIAQLKPYDENAVYHTGIGMNAEDAVAYLYLQTKKCGNKQSLKTRHSSSPMPACGK